MEFASFQNYKSFKNFYSPNKIFYTSGDNEDLQNEYELRKGKLL